MTYEPIKTLEVENYGCIKKASFELTPLHALIGPNDSGKSTVLRALRTAAQFGAGTFEPDAVNAWLPFDPLLEPSPTREDVTTIGLHYKDGLTYLLQSAAFAEVTESVSKGERDVAKSPYSRGWNVPGLLARRAPPPQASREDRAAALKLDLAVDPLRSRISVATMVRFDPDNLRAPAPLVPESRGIAFADERGTGLAGVFDAFQNRDNDAFTAIRARVQALFPTIERFGLINASDSRKEISVTLTDGNRLPARALSEGLLYYLGFAALKYIDKSSLFLVEEPENGLHPSRIADVMAVLREISKTSQVVIATHSPLVINELQGNEISVVTRHPDEGTRVKLLKDVPGFDDASKVYLPGEFWVSYADGKMEEPLLTGKPRP